MPHSDPEQVPEDEKEELVIFVEAIFGMMTGLPLVRIALGDEEITLVSGQALDLAQTIINAACAAEGDAALFHALKDNVPVEGIASLLLQVRATRGRLQPEWRQLEGE